MRICMACGCNKEADEKYLADCKDLISNLMKDSNDLVFGTQVNGIMGLAYTIAKYYNRKVTAIVPRTFKDDLIYVPSDEEIITNTIGERTNSLINYSDALLVLPGGIGTVYELFSFIEMKRGKEFNKPIAIYNALGYFNDVLAVLDTIYKAKFANEDAKQIYFVSSNKEEIINYIYNYKYNS